MKKEQIFSNVTGETNAGKNSAENEKDESGAEKREQMKETTVLFVRHGDSTYEEEEWFNCNDEEWSEMKKEKEIIPFEGKLTEKGIKQMKDTAMKIVEKIGSGSKKVVYLRTSPKERTKESMEIIKEVLGENGIDFYPKKNLAKTTDDLRDLGLTGEFLEKSEKSEEQVLEWMDFWKEKHRDFEGVEQEKEFMRRLQKTISYFQQFSLKANLPSDCEPVFICLTHEEVIKNVAEHFGIEVEIVENGEVMEMKINPKEDEPSELSINIQGQESTLSSDKLFRPGI